jgi:putative tryptophan/tyrosine transport system substrate-binding protein
LISCIAFFCARYAKVCTITGPDRVLRGTEPADLPVQVPVKFEMALNVKTAKSLGLTVPQSMLLLADEVIE